MPTVRLIVAWLIMLAIPLQGLAAASMTYCGGEREHVHQASQLGHSPDHANHAQTPGTGGQPSLDQQSDGALPDAAHECGVCASCCHSVAIMESHWSGLSPLLEQSDLVEPFVHFDAIHSAPPDKPPRA